MKNLGEACLFMALGIALIVFLHPIIDPLVRISFFKLTGVWSSPMQAATYAQGGIVLAIVGHALFRSS